MRRQGRRRRRSLRDRVRGDPQQLLPAGDAGADGGVRRDLGVRSGNAPLPPERLRGPRAALTGARPGRGLRAPAGDRLPLGAPHGRGGGARPDARPVPRLARRGTERLPARARRWLRLQPRVDAGPGGEGARRGGADRRGGRGDRLRRGRLGRRDRRRDERGPDRGRAGRGGGRAVDPAPVGDARVARADRRSLCGRLGGTRGADVDLLVPAGGGGRAGAVDAGHRARRRGARPARRLRSPTCGR